MIVDCLSLWVSNLLEKGLDDDEVLSAASAAAALAARGLVDVGREQRGRHGHRADAPARPPLLATCSAGNAVWAEAADEAVLVVAGRQLGLERP